MAINISQNKLFFAIDTSCDLATLVLGDQTGKVIAFSSYEGRRQLSQRLMSEIDMLLKSNHFTLDDIDVFAVCIGPGSFTGVRVGLTTIKTFAQVSAKPVIGISSADAYARIIKSDIADIHVIMPSKAGEAYAASYIPSETCIELGTVSPQTVANNRIEETLQLNNRSIIIGEEKVISSLTGIHVYQKGIPLFGFVSCIVERMNKQQYDDPIGLVPLYVAPPAITKPRDPSILPNPIVQ